MSPWLNEQACESGLPLVALRHSQRSRHLGYYLPPASHQLAAENGLMIMAEERRCVWCGEQTVSDDHYCPSPAEIEKACRIIRSRWTRDEERRRQVEFQDAWTLPTQANLC